MLTAIRQSDLQKVVGYEILKNSSESYQCEYCNEEVIHHRSLSQVKIGHFKHKPNSLFCANNISESEDHIRTKKDIKEYLEINFTSLNVLELEKWICNNSIRPDIYLETKKGTKIAIEIQASQLTIDQIISRTKKYFKNNIYVLWVLVWKKSKISKSHYITNDCLYRDNCDRHCDHSIKLTEMELFLNWMNFRKLIYWDYEHEHGYSFYVAELDKFIGESSEFYSEYGEHQYFEGRVAKNKKLIVDMRFDLRFDEFKPGVISEFDVPSKNYTIPKRRQLSVK